MQASTLRYLLEFLNKDNFVNKTSNVIFILFYGNDKYVTSTLMIMIVWEHLNRSSPFIETPICCVQVVNIALAGFSLKANK